MIRFLRISTISIASILLLTGCFLRWDIDEIKAAKFEGRDFKMALARQYKDFATSEADNFDWADANHFAYKGLMAAKGFVGEPENPADWDIPQSMIPTLLDAREKLINITNGGPKQSQPELSARAFLLYDCWVEELEENWQIEHIESCRNEFFDAINHIQSSKAALRGGVIKDIEIIKRGIIAPSGNVPFKAKKVKKASKQKIEVKKKIKIPAKQAEVKAKPKAVKPKIIKQKAVPIIKPKPASMTAPKNIKQIKKETAKIRKIHKKPTRKIESMPFSAKTNYAILFDINSSRVPFKSHNVIEEIVKSLVIKEFENNRSYNIIVNGYADSTGDKKHNEMLSAKRAHAVKQLLIKKGIQRSKIKTAGLGAVAPEKMAKANSRKVEIFIK